MSQETLADPDRAWLATLTVLYVEDDAVTRKLVGRLLRRRVGYLLEAADGAEGLERFREERPALVITDIAMPKLDGLSMAEGIRVLDLHVPIVVTTAFEQVNYLQRAIDVGVDKYVTKPISIDKLDTVLLACARRLRGEAMLARERQREIDAVRSHEREALDMLAGGMAHDFNNLLQSLLVNVHLASPLTARGSELHELIGDARAAAEQAAELGARLLTLSGGWFAALHIEPIAPTLRAAVATALEGSETTLHLELEEDLPAVAQDVALLARAFGELALNAREAMAHAGVLSVAVTARDLAEGDVPRLAAGRYVQLTFSDTGPGVSVELLPRIFDSYFSTKPRGSVRGRGLGLPLCLAIVRKHRGAVLPPPAAGSGAVFTVLLPAVPVAPPS